jgi:hypothetical protein
MSTLIDKLLEGLTIPVASVEDAPTDDFFSDCEKLAQTDKIVNSPTSFVNRRKPKPMEPPTKVMYQSGGPRSIVVKRERIEHDNGDVSLIETFADGSTSEKRNGMRL